MLQTSTKNNGNTEQKESQEENMVMETLLCCSEADMLAAVSGVLRRSIHIESYENLAEEERNLLEKIIESKEIQRLLDDGMRYGEEEVLEAIRGHLGDYAYEAMEHQPQRDIRLEKLRVAQRALGLASATLEGLTEEKREKIRLRTVKITKELCELSENKPMCLFANRLLTKIDENMIVVNVQYDESGMESRWLDAVDFSQYGCGRVVKELRE